MFKLKSKLIVAVMVMVGITVFMSCEKEVVETKTNEKEIVDYKDFGKFHNEILNEFYSRKKTKGTLSFDDKVELIDSYLSSVVDSIKPGIFATIIKNQQTQDTFLQEISSTNSDITTGNDIINEMSQNNQISIPLSNYFKEIINAYKQFPYQFSDLLVKIDEIKEKVINDDNITNDEKTKLLTVIIVAKSSIAYWSNDENLKRGKSIQGLPWYVKDAVGAMTGVQTGLVGYATLLAGPWGGAAALIGSAALSSCV